MKKFFSLLLALATIGSASASVILHESFDREVGTLNKGTIQDNMGTNTTDWWCFSGNGTEATAIQVVEGTLSYPGYVSEGKGKQVKMSNGFIADDLRQFNAISSGKVYAAAIINIDAFKESTSNDYFLALGDASASDMWARLYIQGIKNTETGVFTGYKLGITKFNETSAISYVEKSFAGKDTLLVVLEYEFVDGEKNDIARLYINPTAKTTTPDAVSSSTVTPQKDVSSIRSINLRQGPNTPTSLYVDEIKVTTAWADLFETQETAKAEIKTGDLVFAEDFFYANETYTTTWNISGTNLTNDIVLSSSCEGLSFAPSTVKKEDAMAEGGATVTVTFAAGEPSGEDYNGQETITLTSGETTETYTVYGMFVSAPIAKCNTLAEVFLVPAGEYGIECIYTGEAVVTYINGTTYTLEDATGAIVITAEYNWFQYNIALGDGLSGFYLSGSEWDGIFEWYLMTTNLEIVSNNNKLTPQEVTLAALLADTENKYLNHLVVVKNVLFDDTAVLLGSGNTPITQGETVANINLPAGNPLIDTAKPTKAVDITGVWAAGLMNTKYLRPRTAADIVEHTATGIEAATFDAETEIYTIQGMRVESLQPGVNIIRKGNTVYKVVR